MRAQKRRLEDGHEGGQGPTMTVEPCSSSSSPTFMARMKISYVKFFLLG